jgi:hypothetical protein
MAITTVQKGIGSSKAIKYQNKKEMFLMEKTKNLRIARGSWQQEIWDNLLKGYSVTSPVSGLRGKAKTYSGKYQESFRNLLVRAQEAGYKIIRTPGKLGGEWSATYKLDI